MGGQVTLTENPEQQFGDVTPLKMITGNLLRFTATRAMRSRDTILYVEEGQFW